MKKELLDQFMESAEKDAAKRKDLRYREVMGFLVAKGFLRSNQDILKMPNKRIRIADAIWAGENVEPRILEVLPAALLRLRKHFEILPGQNDELLKVVELLRTRKPEGPELWGIPFSKFQPWVDIKLSDGRVKLHREKRVLRTYRLKPETLLRLKALAQKLDCTETEVIERAVGSAAQGS